MHWSVNVTSRGHGGASHGGLRHDLFFIFVFSTRIGENKNNKIQLAKIELAELTVAAPESPPPPPLPPVVAAALTPAAPPPPAWIVNALPPDPPPPPMD